MGSQNPQRDPAAVHVGYDEIDVLHTGEKNPRHSPKDKYHLAFFLMGVLGMGALYPWNFFITAADYFHYSFRNTTDPSHTTTAQKVFESTLSVVACSCGVLGLIVNTVLTRYVSFKVRIFSGFIVIALIFTVTTALAAVNTDSWQTGFFTVTMISVVIINLASSWVNGGISGVQGCLPSEFSTAMMVGQAIAGLFATFASILSVLSQQGVVDKNTAVKNQGTGYFGSAVAATVLCTIGFAVFIRLPIINYYLQSLVVKKVKAEITETASTTTTNVIVTTAPPQPFDAKLVVRRIWPLAASLIITFATTLAVFPAVASSVRSRNSADGSLLTNDLFLAVACFLIFNVGDCAGRFAHGFLLFPNQQQGLLTLAIAVVRTGLIPMFLFCNGQPRHHLSVAFGDAIFVVLVATLAFSNGYLGNLGMMYGPKLVPPPFAETTGSIMALCLNTGLLLGSILSFAMIYVV